MPATIPATLSEITPDWLTKTLRGSGLLSKSSVMSIDYEVIGEERGFTGVVGRVQLQYDQPEPAAPQSIIAKLPFATRTIDSSYRQAQAQDAVLERRYVERCQREATFYREVAPTTPLAPHAYAALTEPDDNRLLLLLEDLSEGEPGDALIGCSVDQARVVIDEIASHHAHWWQHPTLAEMPWLSPWANDPQASAARFRGQIDPVLKRFGDRIPVRVQSVIRHLPDHYADILAALTGSPSTMIHADLHLDNVIFLRYPSGQSAKVIDWQSVSRGLAAVDLATFIVGSLDAPTRRAAEIDLLRRYHDTISDAGVTNYSFDQLLTDMRRALLWQLAGTVGWLARVDLSTLEGRELALVEAIFAKGRVFAAVLDYAPSMPMS
jgi:hypothetical protein